MSEPKLWITTRRIRGGRIISWRAGRRLIYQLIAADGSFIQVSANVGTIKQGEGFWTPYMSPHGVPSWREVRP